MNIERLKVDARMSQIVRHGDTVFMARNAWDLNRIQEDWPNIRFLTTRERA